jgi:hypothetical protein
MPTIRLILVRGTGQRTRLLRTRNRSLRFHTTVNADETLETIREYFRESWSCEVHALKWLFPADLFLGKRSSPPYLVLHVDRPNRLSHRETPFVCAKATSQHGAQGDLAILRLATRRSPIQPWSEPVWLKRTEDWLVTHLGSEAVRDIRQVRVNATGAVLKFTGGMGACFFLKALPTFLAYETRLLATLHDKLPNVCATLLQVHRDKNFHITCAIDGVPLETISELKKWKVALASVTEMQIAASRHLGDLQLAGVPFQTLKNLYGSLEASLCLLLSMGACAPNRLNRAERKLIPVLAAKARGDFECLGECGLPETIIHGDLNESNVFLTSTSQAKFIDWSFSRLGHPFFTLENCLFSTFQGGHRMFNVHEQLRAAYIEPWQAYASRKLLFSGLRAAHRLIPLEAAISMAEHIRDLEAYEPGNVRYIPLLLRKAMVRFGLCDGPSLPSALGRA